MPKHHIPINLKRFEVVTPDITTKDVLVALTSMREWMIEEQTHYYANEYADLIEKLTNDKNNPTGSLNSFGRDIGLEPHSKFKFQPYNLAEMFRVGILSKVAGSIQWEAIENAIIADPSLEPKQIAKQVKDITGKKASPHLIFTIKNRIEKDGSLHSHPSPDGLLNFWATDTHYSKIARDGRYLYFTFKIEQGPVTLRFTLPKSERFAQGKPTRPTVRFTSKKRMGLWLYPTIRSITRP